MINPSMRLITLVFGILASTPAIADEVRQALPTDTVCPVDLPEPASQWSPQEHWAWQRICLGKRASMNHFDSTLESNCNFKELLNGGTGRVGNHQSLSPKFIETLVVGQLYRSVATAPKIQISCAYVPAALNLSDRTIEQSLLISNTLLTELNIEHAQFSRDLRFYNVMSTQELKGLAVEVSGRFVLKDSVFKKKVDLQQARVSKTLDLDGSRFEADLDVGAMQAGDSLWLRNGSVAGEFFARGAQIDGTLELDGSRIDGKLSASQIAIGRSVFLRRNAQFSKVDMRGARIGGQFEATGSTFSEILDMDRIQIVGSLGLYDETADDGEIFDAVFSEIDLANSKIGGNLNAQGATVTGKISADKMHVGGDMRLNRGGSFFELTLHGARVDGNLTLIESTFSGKIDADQVQIGDSLFLRSGGQFDSIDLLAAKIGGHVQIAGSRFSGEINLSGADIAELSFFRRERDPENSSISTVLEPRWESGASLVLRNARIGALQARPNAWKIGSEWVETDLSGARFGRLDGLFGGVEDSMLDASGDQLVQWIEGVRPDDHAGRYDPGPYEHLAGLLRAEGMSGKANRIVYAKFERRSVARPPDTPWWDANLFWPLSKYLVGYGVYPFWLLLYFAALVALGWCVGLFSQSVGLRAWTWRAAFERLWYSLGTALPLVEFSGAHTQIDHGRPWVNSFYHIQKLLGFVLATYLVGALTLLAT